MNDSIKARLEALGLTLPATEGESYYGAAYGTMKPFHITGPVLHLSGHVPIRNGVPLHPGRLGETVSIEQGIEAAELTAMNALAGMKQALGDLERVVSLIKSLNFVACAPNFTDVHLISPPRWPTGWWKCWGLRAASGPVPPSACSRWPGIIATKAGSRSKSAESTPRGSLTRRVISPRSNRHRPRVSTRVRPGHCGSTKIRGATPTHMRNCVYG